MRNWHKRLCSFFLLRPYLDAVNCYFEKHNEKKNSSNKLSKTPYLVHWLIGGSEGPVRHLLHGIVEWQPLNKIHLIPASLAKNVKFLQLWSWKHKYWQFSELLIFIPSCSIMGQNQVKLFFTYFLTYIFGNVNSYWARKFELSQGGKKICEPNK